MTAHDPTTRVLAIEVNGLMKRFGDRVAVSDVTFNVRRGEVFAFLGPNWSGKSTTIRMLCGILRRPPAAGACWGTTSAPNRSASSSTSAT